MKKPTGPELIKKVKAMKLHELLAVGLAALQEAEKPDSLVKPEMRVYHNFDGTTCFACLGGLAVIKLFKVNMRLNKFKRAFNQQVFLEALGKDLIPFKDKGLKQEQFWNPYLLLRQVELTLNWLRVGELPNAYREWYGVNYDAAGLYSVNVVHYVHDKVRFYQDMAKVLEQLTALNL